MRRRGAGRCGAPTPSWRSSTALSGCVRLTLLAASLSVAGGNVACIGMPGPEDAAERSALATARLTESEARALADRAASDHVKGTPGHACRLEHYRASRMRFDPDTGRWGTVYMHDPMRWLGDHFLAVVDDASCEVTFAAGA